MKTIKFTKVQGSGNDFVVIDSPRFQVAGSKFIQKICDRKYGIGADGLLLIEKSKKADVRMRIFNNDGSEANMCGNGARCAALFISLKSQASSLKSKTKKLTIETKAGIIEAEIAGGNTRPNRWGRCAAFCGSVKIKLTDPVDLKLDIHVNVRGKDYEVDYLNTGVPHAVVEVDDLDNLPVSEIGRAIRHHEVFKPRGANVDFIKIIDKDHVAVRTYERGVEDETLACGTGSVASAIISVLNSRGESFSSLGAMHKVFVMTRSKEELTVYFKASKKKIEDVWLEGRAEIVFRGEWPRT